MTHQRYRLSFLLSVLIFLILGMGIFSLLEVEKKLQVPKKEHLVKVALLTLPTPVKHVAPKPVVPMVVPPNKIIPPTPHVIKKKPKPKPIVKPKKIIKKHKPKKLHKKIVKKILKKHKPKSKKVHKKIIKKPKPKKVHRKIVKKIIKKHKPKTLPKKIVREIIVPKRVVEQPIIAPMPIRKPIIRKTPKIIKSTPKTSTPTDNGRAKRAFLQNIRNKIIANKKYPRIALRRHIESSVKVRFDITATGQVSNIRFISGKRIFYKSIKKTLARTFPVGIPSKMRGKLPISDVAVILHFNIR